MTVSETAYAKLNLALHVRHRREDGYHALETLFAFGDDGDRIELEAAERLSLTISGPFGDGLESGDDNLVIRAAKAMQAHFGVEAGAAIHLDKRLPVAAGLGGGSADAAAAARALARLWALHVDERALIDAIGHLGADIPACIASRTIRGEGVGERFAEVDGAALSALPVLIANPRLSLSTPKVFAAWDGTDREALDHGDIMAAARAGRNDLEPGAIELCPEIAAGLDALAGQGETLCRMSGSGASIFALYPDDAARDTAAEQFASRCLDWWTMKARLR